MSKIYQEHSCCGVPNDKVSVMTLSGLTCNKEDTQWVLYITKLAIEENHHLECEGDLIWTTTIAIKNCHYCGIELQV
ncbi:MAG: hypothetical protein ACI8P9_001619 [Parasphingorhabdus sp.]|jgi:hypothetical protein